MDAGWETPFSFHPQGTRMLRRSELSRVEEDGGESDSDGTERELELKANAGSGGRATGSSEVNENLDANTPVDLYVTVGESDVFAPEDPYQMDVNLDEFASVKHRQADVNLDVCALESSGVLDDNSDVCALEPSGVPDDNSDVCALEPSGVPDDNSDVCALVPPGVPDDNSDVCALENSDAPAVNLDVNPVGDSQSEQESSAEEDEPLDIRCGSCNLFGTPDTTQPCGEPSCLYRICTRCSIETDYCMNCEEYCSEGAESSLSDVRAGQMEVENSLHEEAFEQNIGESVPMDDRDLPAHVALKWGEWFENQNRASGELPELKSASFENVAGMLIDELSKAPLPQAPQRTNIRASDVHLCEQQGPPRFLLLGAYTTRGAGVTAATSTPRGRRLLQLVHQLARSGGREQKEYVSVSISEHHGLAPHTDKNNHPDHQSWHIALGDYRGGLLHLSREAAGEGGRAGLHAVRNTWTQFQGRGQHSVTPVTSSARRYGITLFVPDRLGRLSEFDWEILTSYQFPCSQLKARALARGREKMSRRGGELPQEDYSGDATVKAADAYMQWVLDHPEGCPASWKKAVSLGTSLIMESQHDVAAAVRAVWKCRNQRGLSNLSNAEQSDLADRLEPSWAEYLQYVARQGMPARSETPRTERQRQCALPHPSAVNELSQVYRALWKDIKKGRILLVATEELEGTRVQSSPLAAVPKMLPNRTLSSECRVVHDQRTTNLTCPAGYHPPALQPKHSQIARLVKWWESVLPGIPVQIAKRDISSAFRLIWIAPDDCEIFAADLPWRVDACGAPSTDTTPLTKDSQIDSEPQFKGVTAIFMVMSFGFTGAPGEWAPWGLATSMLHRTYVPEDPYTEGPWSFHSHILVDDAVLVEPMVGNRASISASCYEENTKALLGEGAINQEKVVLEGAYSHEATVWGLTMNTHTGTIGLPEQRLLKGAHLLALPVYSTGNYEITLKDLQKLRGTAQSWTPVLPGLRLVLRAIDVFLKPTEPDAFVQPSSDWPVHDAWTQLWSAFDLLKLLVARPELWKERFVTSMTRLLTVSEQLGLPGAAKHARVISSDATPEIHGAVDWTARLVTRQSVEKFMECLTRQGEEARIIIAVAELLGLVAMAATLGHTWRHELIIYIGDNTNVVQWLKSRAPRNKLAQMLMKTLMCLEVKEKFVVHAYYVRTYHNSTADWLTRCTQEEFQEGLRTRKLEWVDAELPWREALVAAERGNLLFLVGMDEADLQVAQTLTTQRLESMPSNQLEDIHTWVLYDMDEPDGDYAAVWQGWNGRVWEPEDCGRLICTGTAPPDPSGVKGLKLAQRAVQLGAEAVVFDAPRVHDWSRTESFLREREWAVTAFEFDSTTMGAAVWRQRRGLIARKGDVARPPTPEELGLQVVVGTPARHFLHRCEENEADAEADRWVTRPQFVLEPQLGRVFSPTGPKGAGHVCQQGVRKLICSVGSPLPAPRVTDGRIEQLEVWDPSGKAGYLRRVQPQEWQNMQQGRERSLDATVGSAIRSLQQPGVAVAAGLLTAAMCTPSARPECRGGAGTDHEDEEIMFAMREWTNAWRRGQFPDACHDVAAGTKSPRPRNLALEELGTEPVPNPGLLRCGGRTRNQEASEQAARASVRVEDPQPPHALDVQAEMEQWLADRLGGGLAESTRRNYNKHWEAWRWWRAQRDLPLYLEGEGRSGRREDETELLQFLAFHGLMGASVHKLRSMIFAIQRNHREAGAGDPLEGKQRIWIVLTSMARRGSPQTRKAGVTPPMLEWLYKQLAPTFQESGPEGMDAVVLWATVLVGYLFLARASELVAVTHVDGRKIIRACDVAFKDEDGLPSDVHRAERVEVTFRHQKADQVAFGAVRTHYRIRGEGDHLCVVRALGNVWKRFPNRAPKGNEHHLPLFRWTNGSVVNRGALQNVLKRAARAVGVPPERTVVHSLRVGGASALYQATGSIDIVQRWGRWASGAFHRYLWEAAEQSKGLASVMTRVEATIQS
eukprot:4454252-Amphidinium_carterae.1